MATPATFAANAPGHRDLHPEQCFHDRAWIRGAKRRRTRASLSTVPGLVLHCSCRRVGLDDRVGRRLRRQDQRRIYRHRDAHRRRRPHHGPPRNLPGPASDESAIDRSQGHPECSSAAPGCRCCRERWVGRLVLLSGQSQYRCAREGHARKPHKCSFGRKCHTRRARGREPECYCAGDPGCRSQW